MAGTNFYRARLDIRDRLLFNFVTYRDNRYLLLLEVIKDHNYARSRFLNGGAVVNEDKLTPIESAAKEMENAAVELPYIYPEVKKIHTLNKFISFDQFQQSVYTMYPPPYHCRFSRYVVLPDCPITQYNRNCTQLGIQRRSCRISCLLDGRTGDSGRTVS